MEVSPALQGKYFEHRRQDLVRFQRSLENGDFQEIERIGHKIKGSASTFGHPELTVIGKKLESAAIKKETEIIRSLLVELSIWLDQYPS